MHYVKTNNEPFIITFEFPVGTDIASIFQIGAAKHINVSNKILVVFTEDAQNSSFIKTCMESSQPIDRCDVKNLVQAVKLAKTIRAEYMLIVNSYDSFLTRDLDQDFIDTFEALNTPIIFSGNEIQMLQDDFSNSKALQIAGPCKFMDAGIIFGKVEFMEKFIPDFIAYYQANKHLFTQDIPIKLFNLIAAFDTFVSSYEGLDYAKVIDSESKLFGAINENEHRIEEYDGNRYIKAEGNYIFGGGII